MHSSARSKLLVAVLGCFLACASAAAQEDVVTFSVSSRDGANVLEWQNPENPPYGGTRIVGRTDRFPTDAQDTDGAFVVDVVGTLSEYGSVPHDGLENGTRYFYGAFVGDGASVFSPGKLVSGVPFDTSGPVKWRFAAADAAVSMTPPGIGPAILLPNNNGTVYAVERGVGGGEWAPGFFPGTAGVVQHRPPVLTVPGFLGDARFSLLGAQDGVVRALDIDTGDVLWTSPDFGMFQAGPGAWFVRFGGSEDYVLIGTRNDLEDNLFLALHADDGTEAWRFDDASGTGLGIVSGSPTIDYARGRVYFASRERSPGADTVFALDLTSGAKVWSVPFGSVSGSPILRGGVLYFGNDDGVVYGVEAGDGLFLKNAPFVTGDGTIKGFIFPDFAGDALYFSTTSQVWALRDVGPEIIQLWSHSGIPAPSIVTYPPGSRYLWVGSSNGGLYQIDVTTGNPGLPPQARSVLLGDGTAGAGSPSLDLVHGLVYVGTEDGSLYAVAVPF